MMHFCLQLLPVGGRQARHVLQWLTMGPICCRISFLVMRAAGAAAAAAAAQNLFITASTCYVRTASLVHG
jgi:hypothetical protein